MLSLNKTGGCDGAHAILPSFIPVTMEVSFVFLLFGGDIFVFNGLFGVFVEGSCGC